MHTLINLCASLSYLIRIIHRADLVFQRVGVLYVFTFFQAQIGYDFIAFNVKSACAYVIDEESYKTLYVFHTH